GAMPRQLAAFACVDAPEMLTPGFEALRSIPRRQASFFDMELPALPQSYWNSPEGVKCREKVNDALSEDDQKGAQDEYTLHHLEQVADKVGLNCKRALRDLEGTPSERLAKIQAGVESLF
ncbi:unnamed protein product, partial [Effrenium voratum]